MKDLFNFEIDPKPIPRHGYKRLKYARNYKQSDHPIRRCKYCMHCVGVFGNSRNYYKCRLIGITSSEATDIRLRNVCMLWDMEVNNLEEFETWYDANFWEGREIRNKIINKVNDLYHGKGTAT